jgi:hypothetical protein
MFSLTIDASRKLIRTTFEGFLELDEVAEWGRQEQAAAAAMGCRSREFLLYVDTARCAIQSQEVVALFQELIATAPRKARRIAIMQGTSLTKMQTRRIVAGNDHIAHFSDEAEAEEWLHATVDA